MARKILKLTTHDTGTHYSQPKREVPFFVSTYAIVAFEGHTEQGSHVIYDDRGNPIYENGRECRTEWSHFGTLILMSDENGNKCDKFVLETPEVIANMIADVENV